MVMSINSRALFSMSSVNYDDPASLNAVGRISVPLLIINKVQIIKMIDKTIIIFQTCLLNTFSLIILFPPILIIHNNFDLQIVLFQRRNSEFHITTG